MQKLNAGLDILRALAIVLLVQSRLIYIHIKSLETQAISFKIRKNQLGDFVLRAFHL